ncbi:MAG: hypothetical protein HC886_22620 [Leptolyngbyaceae cyanobacterium SM1_1_3]|nr:hypothetical protein [Leptolyngbyaceae cyanobacterium SM1_1_3]NJN03317.1 hypothetical protein [Leptolyngbyaceae cyanobacterium RM1_1_2]NJO11444.1 hypothetical protein [Leptolyngbyaceae cyanobacterium SL_1_1]
MTSLILLSNLILAGLTGFYAWFVMRLLQQLQQEQTQYREALTQQLQQTTLPYLHWDLRGQDNSESLLLDLFNIGNVPAYDILISTIAAYNEETLDIPTFMRTLIQPRHRKYPLQADKVGYYGIRTSLRLSLLPSQKQITLPITIQLRPADVYALIQYRELSGSNYYQLYCFSDVDELGCYRANLLEPSSPIVKPRIHFHDSSAAEASETDDEAESYFLKDFVELWNHSLSSRLTLADDTLAKAQNSVIYDL